MTWVAVAVAGAAVIGGTVSAVSSSDSSRRAAHTQADAAGAATDAQTRATEEGIGAQATATGPWRNLGAGAMYQLANLLGIDPQTAFPGATSANGTPVPGSNLIPGLPQPGKPDANFGSLLKPFSQTQFQADPGYQFRLSEGQRGLTNSALAQGMGLSGATLKGLDRYNQDFASNEYNNSYNRYNQDQSNQFNRLADVAGLGQTSAQQTGNTAATGMMNLGNSIGSNLIGAGNANAAGQIGQNNAITGGLTNVGNSLMQQYYMRNLFGGSNGTYNGQPDYLNQSNQQQVSSDINTYGSGVPP